MSCLLIVFLKINPTYIGATAGVLTAISLLPQLIKILKAKEAEDVSMTMLLILFLGLGLWIVYGFLQNDWPLILTNICSLILNFLIIYFSAKYSKGKKSK